MKQILIGFQLVSLIVVLVFMASAKATTLPDFPFVTVTGTSSQQVKPDVAELGFQINTFNKVSNVANDQLSDTVMKVVNVLNKYGVEEDNITAFETNKIARRGNYQNINQTDITGYEFNRVFNVTIKDLSRYANIIDELQSIDNVSNFNTNFDASNKADIEIQLISKATEKAKQKATLMAEGLGVRLDGVFAFNDTGSFTNFFATFGLSDSHSGIVMAERTSFNQGNSIFIPKYIEVSKTINVIYKIRR